MSGSRDGNMPVASRTQGDHFGEATVGKTKKEKSDTGGNCKVLGGICFKTLSLREKNKGVRGRAGRKKPRRGTDRKPNGGTGRVNGGEDRLKEGKGSPPKGGQRNKKGVAPRRGIRLGTVGAEYLQAPDEKRRDGEGGEPSLALGQEAVVNVERNGEEEKKDRRRDWTGGTDLHNEI